MNLLKTSPVNNFRSASYEVPLRTWVVVVDINNAYIFEERNKEQYLIKKISSPKSNNKLVQCTIKYGRETLLQCGPNLYTQESDYEPLSFAHKISAWFDEAVWNDRFDCLVLVSAPHLLKDLHRALSVPVKGRIIASINA